jgi:hypothetical protein
MKKSYIVLAVLLTASIAFGRAGGGHSFSGSSFGGSRSSSYSSASRSGSSFGGSRARSSGVTITRPAPRTAYTTPSVVHSTTVIHSGPSWVDWMIMDSMFHRTPAVVVTGDGTLPQQIVVQEQHGFLYKAAKTLFLLLIIGFICWLAYKLLKYILDDRGY